MTAGAPPPRSERVTIGLASWYTAGRSDGFGDRLLMFDNSGAPSLELLRFRPELAAEPGFESLLRQRVQRLSTFVHTGFGTVRTVEHLDGGEGLALVSTHVAGKRLSDVLVDGRAAGVHPAVAGWLISQLSPLLNALQAHGYDIVHGALTLDRVVITSEGRAAVVEQALGSALRGLEWSPTRLWKAFNIITRPTSRGEACIDVRGDVMQLGVLTLSLLLGRLVQLDDVPRLATLLDEAVALPKFKDSPLGPPLRHWLERALQLHPQSYRSAAESQEGAAMLPAQAGTSLPEFLAAMASSPTTRPHARAEVAPREVTVDTSAEATAPPVVIATQAPVEPAVIADAPEVRLASPPPVPVLQAPTSPGTPTPVPPPVAVKSTADMSPRTDVPVAPVVAIPVVSAPPPEPRPSTILTEPAQRSTLLTVRPPVDADLARADTTAIEVRGMSDTEAARLGAFETAAPAQGGLRRWLVPALAAVVVVEAIGLAFFATRRAQPSAAPAAAPLVVAVESAQPNATVFVNGRSIGAAPTKVTVDAETRSIRIVAPPTPPPAPSPAAAATPSPGISETELAQAAARQRSGGVRFVTTIPLQILEGNRVLGTTADGPVVATAGAHQLDLVNTELGFRTRQAVNIRTGEIVSVSIALPMGRLNANAQPWAQVFVDGASVGETPVANLSVPIGQHEVTFRHPQLGEQKETVVVRADGVARVSTAFGR